MAIVELFPEIPDESERDKPTSASRFKSVADALGDLRSIFISIIIGLVVLVLISYVVVDIVNPAIFLQPILVPAKLQKLGYTNEVVTQRLLEDINMIRDSNKSQRSFPNFSSTMSSPDIVIAETGISLRSFISLVRQLVAVAPNNGKIDGEIILHPQLSVSKNRNNTYMYELYLKHLNQTVDVKSEDIDQLFMNGAQAILKNIDKYALAVYLEDRNPEVALGLVREILITNPKDDRKWAYNLWGNILNDGRLFDDAIDKFKKAIQIDPNFERPWNNIGSSYEHKGDLERAVASYKQATTLNPKDPYPWNGWGDILLKEGDFDGAIEKYQRSSELPPKEWYPWVGWGDALVLKGDFEEAVDKYESAIQLDPDAVSMWNLWSPWIGWGTALCLSHNKADAIRKYEHAVDAIRKYEQALALQPSLLVKLRTVVAKLKALKTEQVGECVPIRGFERLAGNSRAKPSPDRIAIAGMSH